MLKVKASEVHKLTPQVIGVAEEVARDPTESHRLGDLQLTSHQWAGHVSQLIEATQKANYPWSKTAEKLVSAAKKGESLEDQVIANTTHIVSTSLLVIYIHIVTAKNDDKYNIILYFLYRRNMLAHKQARWSMLLWLL